MKKIYLLTLLLSMSLIANAQTAFKGITKKGEQFRAGESHVGFCWADRSVAEKDLYYVGIPNVAIAGYVETPQLTVNHTLKSVSLPWGGDTDPKGQILVLNSDTTVKYVQPVTLNPGWNTFTLTSPLTLEPGKYFIGIFGHTKDKEKGFVLPFDHSDISLPMANWANFTRPKPSMDPSSIEGYKVGEKPVKVGNTQALHFGSLIIGFELEGPDTQNYALVNRLSGSTKGQPNEQHIFSTSIRNVGSNPITSFTLTYDTKGVKQELNINENIEGGSSKDIETLYTFPEKGILQTTEATISTVNGQDNPLKSYGASIVYNVLAENGPFKVKNVLLEEFTTEKCPNCPRAKPHVEEAVQDLRKAGYKVAVAAHHAGFYNDWLTQTESSALLPYIFKGAGSFAPALVINRINTYVGGETHGCATSIGEKTIGMIPGWLESTYQYGNFQSVVLTENGITVKGSVVNGVDKDNVFLHIYICENGLQSHKQAGAGSDYIHENVIRKFVYPITGEKIEISDDNTFSVNAPITLDPSWKKNKIYAIAFITGPLGTANKGFNLRQVYASESADFNGNGAGVKDLAVEKPYVSVMNNCVKVYGDFFSFAVYNLEGKMVATNDTTTLLPGIYVVKVKALHGTFVYKVTVQR